jgi:hypothetical protein
MFFALDQRDPEVMFETHSARMRHPGPNPTGRVFGWAGRFGVPAAMMGLGVAVLLLELSAGVGWAFLVFGTGFFAARDRAAVGRGTKPNRSRRSIDPRGDHADTRDQPAPPGDDGQRLRRIKKAIHSS